MKIDIHLIHHRRSCCAMLMSFCTDFNLRWAIPGASPTPPHKLNHGAVDGMMEDRSSPLGERSSPWTLI